MDINTRLDEQVDTWIMARSLERCFEVRLNFSQGETLRTMEQEALGTIERLNGVRLFRAEQKQQRLERNSIYMD